MARVLVDLGVIPAILEVIKQLHVDCYENLFLALTNLAMDQEEYVAEMERYEVFDLLLDVQQQLVSREPHDEVVT
jgi:hypothetical protein